MAEEGLLDSWLMLSVRRITMNPMLKLEDEKQKPLLASMITSAFRFTHMPLFTLGRKDVTIPPPSLDDGCFRGIDGESSDWLLGN